MSKKRGGKNNKKNNFNKIITRDYKEFAKSQKSSTSSVGAKLQLAKINESLRSLLWLMVMTDMMIFSFMMLFIIYWYLNPIKL